MVKIRNSALTWGRGEQDHKRWEWQKESTSHWWPSVWHQGQGFPVYCNCLHFAFCIIITEIFSKLEPNFDQDKGARGHWTQLHIARISFGWVQKVLLKRSFCRRPCKDGLTESVSHLIFRYKNAPACVCLVQNTEVYFAETRLSNV